MMHSLSITIKVTSSKYFIYSALTQQPDLTSMF